jgi:hypothetical protein
MQTFQKPPVGVRTTQLQTFKEELRRSGFVEKTEPKREVGSEVMLHVDAITDPKIFVKEAPDSKSKKVRWSAEVRIYERIGGGISEEAVTEISSWAKSNIYEIGMTLAIAFPNKSIGVIDPQRIAWPTNINPKKDAKHYRDAPEFETVKIVTVEGVNRAIEQVQIAEVIAATIGVASRGQIEAYCEADAAIKEILNTQKGFAMAGAREMQTRQFAIGLLDGVIAELQKTQEAVLSIARKLAENQELRTIMDRFVQDRSQSE